MRYLHPVAASETFIAKGVYKFYRDDVLQPGHEAWTRHALAGGGVLTRVDRETDGFMTLAEVLTDEIGSFERVTVREWNTNPNAPYRTLRVDYLFFADSIQVTRRFDDRATDHHTVAIPAEFIMTTQFTLYTPLVFRGMLDAQPKSTLVSLVWQDKEPLVVWADAPPLAVAQGAVEHLTPRFLVPPTFVYYMFTPMKQFLGVEAHHIPVQFENVKDKFIAVLTEYSHI